MQHALLFWGPQCSNIWCRRSSEDDRCDRHVAELASLARISELRLVAEAIAGLIEMID